MSRTTPLIALLITTASVLTAAETPRGVSLPASAIAQAATPPTSAPAGATLNGSFEQLRADIRASQDRSYARELRSLSVDLLKLTEETYHMGIDPQGLEDLGWKISIISRKTETALGRMQKLAQGAAKDPSLEPATADLLQNATDLLNELRRLEIAAPKIREQIGYANEDSRQFAAEVVDAKQNAAKIADEASALLARVK